MESLEQKYFNKLKNTNMFDEKNLVLVTKWNASIGASYITTYGDNLFITPCVQGNSFTPKSRIDKSISKTKKFNKNEISNIALKKSFWRGNKLIIELKNGTNLKYSLVNSSWVNDANELMGWLNKK